MDTQVVPTPWCTTGRIADIYGVRRTTVLTAIRTGRLNALEVTASNSRPMFLVSPLDAERLWGKRVRKAVAA